MLLQDRVRQCLEVLATSPSPDAEAALRSIDGENGYLTCLATVAISDTSANSAARQLAAILLKNRVRSVWETDGAVAAEERQFLKANLFAGLALPERSIRNAVGLTIAVIAETDWPHEWPELAPALGEALCSANGILVQGSLFCLASFLSEISEESQIPNVFALIIPSILEHVMKKPMDTVFVAGENPLVTRCLAFKVLRLCLPRIGLLMTHAEKQLRDAFPAVFQPFLESWWPLLLSSLDVGYSCSEQKYSSCEMVPLHLEVVKIMQALVQFYNQLMGPRSVDVADRIVKQVLVGYYHHYARIYLRLDSGAEDLDDDDDDDTDYSAFEAEGEMISLSALVAQGLECVYTFSSSKHWTKTVTSDQKKTFSEHLMRTLIPYLQCPAGMRAKCESDAHGLVAQENDEAVQIGFDARSVFVDMISSFGGHDAKKTDRQRFIREVLAGLVVEFLQKAQAIRDGKYEGDTKSADGTWLLPPQSHWAILREAVLYAVSCVPDVSIELALLWEQAITQSERCSRVTSVSHPMLSQLFNEDLSYAPETHGAGVDVSLLTYRSLMVLHSLARRLSMDWRRRAFSTALRFMSVSYPIILRLGACRLVGSLLVSFNRKSVDSGALLTAMAAADSAGPGKSLLDCLWEGLYSLIVTCNEDTVHFCLETLIEALRLINRTESNLLSRCLTIDRRRQLVQSVLDLWLKLASDSFVIDAVNSCLHQLLKTADVVQDVRSLVAPFIVRVVCSEETEQIYRDQPIMLPHSINLMKLLLSATAKLEDPERGQQLGEYCQQFLGPLCKHIVNTADDEALLCAATSAVAWFVWHGADAIAGNATFHDAVAGVVQWFLQLPNSQMQGKSALHAGHLVQAIVHAKSLVDSGLKRSLVFVCTKRILEVDRLASRQANLAIVLEVMRLDGIPATISLIQEMKKADVHCVEGIRESSVLEAFLAVWLNTHSDLFGIAVERLSSTMLAQVLSHAAMLPAAQSLMISREVDNASVASSSGAMLTRRRRHASSSTTAGGPQYTAVPFILCVFAVLVRQLRDELHAEKRREQRTQRQQQQQSGWAHEDSGFADEFSDDESDSEYSDGDGEFGDSEDGDGLDDDIRAALYGTAAGGNSVFAPAEEYIGIADAWGDADGLDDDADDDIGAVVRDGADTDTLGFLGAHDPVCQSNIRAVVQGALASFQQQNADMYNECGRRLREPALRATDVAEWFDTYDRKGM